ncbi:Excalibur domain protein [Deinococcus proteolyticus MRP]|uniref:Excalibur domain protein n=1 Tax=Deinococcus proteolyticus (strain ATCC 35074 / DSM 20540 / JCM 6276 / NBRC 101906 / NCIMB 13154 / VKM Ac-1939 / CCM 2703 / MRP) TaxID=693977 RepID=F0RKR4_DEIPM|nr:Excalibur domain protein [Deinococcus proteolyticus MRP]
MIADPTEYYEKKAKTGAPPTPTVIEEIYFPNCAAAAAGGYTNIPKDSPAYRPELDDNGDGVACD